MKTLIFKSIFLIIVLHSSIYSANGQNKIDKKTGNRLGPWSLSYNVKGVDFFDEFHIIPNYLSIAETENEGKEKDLIKTKNNYLKLECTYDNNGVLSGIFSVNLFLYDQSKYSYVKYSVMTGAFENGQLNGTVNIALNFTDSKTTRSIEFSNGQLKDQVITELIPLKSLYTSESFKSLLDNVKMDPFLSSKDEKLYQLGFSIKNQKINSLIVGYDNMVKMEFIGDFIKINCNKKCTYNDFTVMNSFYSNSLSPCAFSQFKFESSYFKDYGKLKNLLISETFYTNGIEEFYLNKNFQKDSVYKIYDNQNNVLFETNFKNGLRNGKAYRYRIDNGKLYKAIEFTYDNDIISGLVKGYFSDGNLMFEINFLKGMPVGKCQTYCNNGICVNSNDIIKSLILDGNIIDPYKVFELKFNLTEWLKKEYYYDLPSGNISTTSHYLFSEKSYNLDSIYNKDLKAYLFNSKTTNSKVFFPNGKLFVEYSLDQTGKKSDWKIFDEFGVLKHSKAIQDKQDNEFADALTGLINSNQSNSSNNNQNNSSISISRVGINESASGRFITIYLSNGDTKTPSICADCKLGGYNKNFVVVYGFSSATYKNFVKVFDKEGIEHSSFSICDNCTVTNVSESGILIDGFESANGKYSKTVDFKGM